MKTITQELITPEIAVAWIAAPRRHHHHLILHHRVETLSAKVQTEGWNDNDEPIIFDRDGCLVDGLHRLGAIAHSKIPQTLTIWRNVEDHVCDKIERGIPK
jgi:hypothetical protein